MNITNEFRNGTAEIVASSVVFIGGLALENSFPNAAIGGFVLSSMLFVDGFRRNIQTRLET